MIGSPGRTRTSDPVVNSHLLYRLSYRGSERSAPRGWTGGVLYSNTTKRCQAFWPLDPRAKRLAGFRATASARHRTQDALRDRNVIRVRQRKEPHELLDRKPSLKKQFQDVCTDRVQHRGKATLRRGRKRHDQHILGQSCAVSSYHRRWQRPIIRSVAALAQLRASTARL